MLAKNLQAAVAGQSAGGYTIERSLRFNSADSAYLSRTPGSAGNRKTWTWSGWVKRSNLDTFNYLIDCNYASNYESQISFNNSSISIGEWAGSTVFNVITTPVYRDVSAWYHIVVAADTTQATASNRIKVYVNGVQVTSFSTANYPSQNYDIGINTAAAHNIGRWIAGTSRYFNGYMTDVHFIDGQALTPADFGKYNATTGVWEPIAYAGTYGTNGFHLDFSDNSSTSTLGTDSSGNSNNWTANNFSVTAGAGNDSLVDTPTQYGTDTGAGGEVGGNYATLNPLEATASGTTYNAVLSNGNLRADRGAGTSDWYNTRSTISPTEKVYIEYTLDGSSHYCCLGLQDSSQPMVNNDYVGYFSGQYGIIDGGPATYQLWLNGSNTSTSYSTSNSGDILRLAFDPATGKLWFGVNNSWYNSGDPGAGTNPTATVDTAKKWLITLTVRNNGVGYINFGQRPYTYTAPSGFKALCTTNLPAPDVVQGDTAFNTVLYTGNGSSLGVTGVGFQPDFAWIKSRSGAVGHIQVDVLRGATKYLQSNNTNGEGTDSNVVASFGADGFTVGSDATTGASGSTYVAWNWKAGGSGVSNTDGSITSTVSANPTAGISVVTYTSPSSGSNQTVGHGLGVKPSLIIVKNRSSAFNWDIYHASLGYNASLTFTANTTRSGAFGAEPTSSVFTTVNNYTHYGTDNYVAYCFAPVEGFSAFGSYTGNGSTDGPFIYTGFRPAFVLVKGSSFVDSWKIVDSVREPYNVAAEKLLLPNSSDAELGSFYLDVLSNGFKPRANNAQYNSSGATYIYMAFAENPFKYSLAR